MGKVIKEDVIEVIQTFNWDKASPMGLDSGAMTCTATVPSTTNTATAAAPLLDVTLTISTTKTTSTVPAMQTRARAVSPTSCTTSSAQGKGLKRSNPIDDGDDNNIPTKKHYKVRSCPLCSKQTNFHGTWT